MENWISQLGTGTKRLSERYAEYPAPAHDQQLYYTYEPHGPAAASKHQYGGGGGHKNNGAMSALTLLAFLFFLHILQQCLKEHMTAMGTPQVMVVSAGREGHHVMAKTTNNDKLDTSAAGRDVSPRRAAAGEVFLTRIATAEHAPRGTHRYKNNIVNYTDRSSMFDGFVSAMDEK